MIAGYSTLCQIHNKLALIDCQATTNDRQRTAVSRASGSHSDTHGNVATQHLIRCENTVRNARIAGCLEQGAPHCDAVNAMPTCLPRVDTLPRPPRWSRDFL